MEKSLSGRFVGRDTVTDKNPNVILNSLTEEPKMPTELTDVDKFVALSAKAKQCNVKRLKSVVKIKLRTPAQLYTLKVEPLKADELIKKLKCEIKEV